MSGATAATAALAREGAALEERQWVRLTRRCNNRCLFCHDSDRQDGTNVPMDRVLEEIQAGRARGAARLVLSGGEATLHPGFLQAVAAGRAAGYRWVQVISNGRMFSYERFTRQAAEAGLDEATVSVHGHTAALHDELAGAPGAFAQALRGIQNLQRAGRVVSVDVVVCRLNVGVLPELLRFFMSMGIMEFDLLHLVPFGRAWDQERDRLFYDPATEAPRLLEALRMAALPGVHLWTNRWPAPLLEGAEHLVQDPHKLIDEVRGTAEGFQALIETGTPLQCAGERCGACVMKPFCSALAEAVERLSAGRFEVVSVTAADAAGLAPGARGALGRQREAAWRITAQDGAAAAAALSLLPAGPGAPLEFDLRRWTGLPGALRPRVRRAVIRDDAALEAALALPGCDLEVPLERATAAVAARALARAEERVVLAASPRSRLSATLAEGLPPTEVAALAGRSRAEALPRCLAPRAVLPRARIEAATLRPDGLLDLFPWAERYVAERSRTRSLRCGGCAETDRCDGAHVNEVRAHGFSFMRPIGVA